MMESYQTTKYFLLLLQLNYVFTDQLFVIGGRDGAHYIKQLQEMNDDYFCKNTCLLWIRGVSAFVCGNDFKGKLTDIQEDGRLLLYELTDNDGYYSPESIEIIHIWGEKISNPDKRRILNIFVDRLKIERSEEVLKGCDMNNFMAERTNNLSIKRFIKGKGIQRRNYKEPPFTKDILKPHRCYILHNNNGVHSQLFAWVGRDVDYATSISLKNTLTNRKEKLRQKNFHLEDENVKLVKDRLEPWQFRINFKNWGKPEKYDPAEDDYFGR